MATTSNRSALRGPRPGPVVVVLALALAIPACGGGGSSSSSSSKPVKRATSARRRGHQGKVGQLDSFPQIDSEFRRKFTDAAFQPDPTGDENRDPFRSYVVRQGTLGREKSSTAVEPTNVCKVKNSKATGYSLRDLRLVGIVLRGTRSYAQFRDPAGYGWIVRRHDCLGKEKAVVESIGVGTVTVEMMPEAGEGGQAQPERRDIALYPEEALPETSDQGGAGAGNSQRPR